MKKKAEKLEALAVELRLTPFQRRFAEELVKDPERNQTKAVVLARKGLNLKPYSEGSAASEGARSLRIVKVQKYLAALTDHAKEAIVRSGGAVLSLQQNLEALSDMAKGRIATETRTYHEVTADGKKLTRAVNRFERAKAHETLLKHWTGEFVRENAPPTPPAVTVNLSMLSMEDLKALKAIRAKLVGEGSTQEKESA